jgi:hypothetical protein
VIEGGLKILSSEKIKSERPRLVKCLVTALYVFVAFSVTTSLGAAPPDINARSYGSKVNRRSAAGRVYLFDMMDGAQELPQTGRLVLLRQGDAPAMALRVLKQYPDKRQYAAKWLRRYSGTKDLDPGSQFITIEKVSDKENPPLTTQDKKDLKEIETPATPVAPPVVEAAPVTPPPPAIVQTPAPQAVAPTPEPPTAPLPVPSAIANNAAPTPPPVLAVPSPVATPEVAAPVVMASPEAPAPLPEPSAPPVAANQDLTAPPLAPAPTASEAAAPAPPAEAAIPAPTPTDTTIPPPAAAVAENIPPPTDNTPTPPAPKEESVPDTAGETAAVSGNGDDLSSIMVEEMKIFDRDENAISLGAGLFRNTLVSGGTASSGTGYSTSTIYSSGGLIRYSRTLKHMLHYKSKTLQDSFALDGTLGFYKYLGATGNGDTYTIVPFSVIARYTLQPSESFGFFGYLGFMKNVVAQSVNADPYTQAGFNSFFPEVGVGMLFQIGPSWYMRADLGLDLIGLSISLKF